MVRPTMFPALLVCYSLVAQTPAPAPNPTPTAVADVKQISLQDAIQVSLQNNLQVDIAKETRTSSQAGVLLAEGTFDWNLTSGLSLSRQDSPWSPEKNTSWNRTFSVGAQKTFGIGGNLQLNYTPYDYSASRFGLNNAATTAPYSAGFSARYTQHLLDGFGRATTEVNVIVAKNQSQAADLQFRLQIINLVATTESQYWDLVYSQRNLENAKLALELAKKSLNENKTRVEVGTMAPIEVTSAEAAVAQKEQAIIVAEAALANASDALIRTLYPVSEHPGKVLPSDAPTLSHIQVDEASAEKLAIENRLELKSLKLDLESKGALRTAAENRLKPTLDAFVTYNGVSNTYDGYSKPNSDITGTKYPGYTVGLNFAIPIGNRAAKGSVAQARANERISQLSMKDQQLGILLEVRQAYRNVDSSEKGVEATKKTRIFREKDLEAEQKKFENGMSTNFVVLSKQNDLDSARAQELQAQITYAKSVTALEVAVGNLMNARNLVFPK